MSEANGNTAGFDEDDTPMTGLNNNITSPQVRVQHLASDQGGVPTPQINGHDSVDVPMTDLNLESTEKALAASNGEPSQATPKVQEVNHVQPDVTPGVEEKIANPLNNNLPQSIDRLQNDIIDLSIVPDGDDEGDEIIFLGEVKKERTHLIVVIDEDPVVKQEQDLLSGADVDSGSASLQATPSERPFLSESLEANVMADVEASAHAAHNESTSQISSAGEGTQPRISEPINTNQSRSIGPDIHNESSSASPQLLGFRRNRPRPEILAQVQRAMAQQSVPAQSQGTGTSSAEVNETFRAIQAAAEARTQPSQPSEIHEATEAPNQDGAGQGSSQDSEANGEMDFSWMNSQIENDDDEIEKEYERLKAVNEEKDRLGSLSIKDRVALRAAENEKELRARRRNKPRDSPAPLVSDEGLGDGLFVPEIAPSAEKRKRVSDESENEEDDENEDDIVATAPNKRSKSQANSAADSSNSREQNEDTSTSQQMKKATGPRRRRGNIEPSLEETLREAFEKSVKKKQRKATGPRARTAREVRDKAQEKQLEKEKAKAEKRANRAKNSKSKRAANGPGSKGTKGSGSAGVDQSNGPSEEGSSTKRKSSKRTNDSGGVTDLLVNLLRHNAVEDRAAQEDDGEAPIISKTARKDKMLEDLLASVPAGGNKRQAGVDKRDLLKASRNFGLGWVRAGENGRWAFKGMKLDLYHHQLIAADFMVSRECGTSEPFGGMLCDDMGLGKTVITLAAIVGNPPLIDPKKKTPAVKTTLIVMPSGAVKQWEKEIEKHVNPGLFKKILHYKQSKEISMPNLEDQDIILTSYAEVMRSFPVVPDTEEIEDLKEFVDKAQRSRGPLHRMRFYRIILDESHTIKNHRSRTSMACQTLDAQYRWCLSATLIQNRLEEVYPYFRFLRVPYARNFKEFQQQFSNPKKPECLQRMAHVMSYLMLRRTMSHDKYFGRPIISLPQTHPEVIHLTFSKAERILYETLEDKFRQDLNRYFKERTASKNYGNIVVMLLRLRQATCHPYLLERTIKESFTLEDLKQLQAKLKGIEDSSPFFEQIDSWIKDVFQKHDINGLARADGDPSAIRSDFGRTFDFERYLETLDETAMLERCICRLCGDVAQEARISDCKHVFCSGCISLECQKSADAGQDVTQCPVCGQVFNSVTPYSPLRAKTVALDEENDRTEKCSWLNQPGPILPSAKMLAVKAKILQWLTEAPDEKIVVFAQFHIALATVKKICDEEGWGAVILTGKTSVKNREAIKSKFEDDPNIKIMIAGLKCGGQALNLNVASRVILIDLWWNDSVEAQAFGSIGQAKETYFTRLAVKGTVDDRLIKMQENKRKIVNNALQDGDTGVKLLSVEELAELFGYMTKDDDGNPFAMSDSDN